MYQRCGFDSSSNPSTLFMLSDLEAQLEDLLSALELMPEDEVKEQEKKKEKIRREAKRIEAKEAQEVSCSSDFYETFSCEAETHGWLTYCFACSRLAKRRRTRSPFSGAWSRRGRESEGKSCIGRSQLGERSSSRRRRRLRRS